MDFSETIIVYDIKVGICSELNENMNLYINGQCHSLILGCNIFKLIFSLEIASLIEARFHMEPPWDSGIKVCVNGLGCMTMMAAMPIYGKNLKNLLL